MMGSTNAPCSRGELSVRIHQRLGSFQLAVDFHAPLGLIVLFGASGAGKSLTLRSLAGLLHPQVGHITLDGCLLFDSAAGLDVPSQERRIGYVPQHYALFPHLTVAENVDFGLPSPPRHSQQLPRSKQRARRLARISELLTALELQDLAGRYPSTLSGGQQQRVALTRALAAEPRLLLLDEPFNALDVAVRERLRQALKQFQQKFAIPIVLVTHDHAEAQQLADTIVVLQQGRVVQVGSSQEIFLAPRTPDVADLVGQHNVFGGYLSTPGSESPSAPTQALRLCWLQTGGAQRRLTTLPVDGWDRGWLPLAAAPPLPLPANKRTITGCILADEVLVYPWPGNAVAPPTWTPRGSVQWQAIILDVRLSGHAVQLLVQPQWWEEQEQPIHTFFTHKGVLEIYLKGSRWRDFARARGQALLLEIGPEAIHWFEGDKSPTSWDKGV